MVPETGRVIRFLGLIVRWTGLPKTGYVQLTCRGTHRALSHKLRTRSYRWCDFDLPISAKKIKFMSRNWSGRGGAIHLAGHSDHEGHRSHAA